MIVFDLRCTHGHVFEAWFGSSADYDSQRERGLVECPLCGSGVIEKAVMAPRVGAKGNRGGDLGRPDAELCSDPRAVKRMLAEVAALQKKILENSSYVGERFAEEARAIHHGEAETRPIHGRATRAEAESLFEEGIPVAPLPLPLAEPVQEN